VGSLEDDQRARSPARRREREWSPSSRQSHFQSHSNNLGTFATARRMIVHPKFTKSYSYNTFITLNNFGVEVKIFDGTAEIVQWIHKSLRVIRESTITRDPTMSKSNQRCPIFAWASHYQVSYFDCFLLCFIENCMIILDKFAQIAFKSGMFESEAVFTISGSAEVSPE
ncbi:unnamed protein product, partial [Cylicostephanus goldi]